MKKLLFILISVFTIHSICYSQENFEWDEVIPVEGTKAELYSKAKMVIAESFNSAENVTHNSDMEAGIIFIKAETTDNLLLGLANYKYYFRYEITILMKDNKYRLLLKDVVNYKTIINNSQYKTIPIATRYPAKNEKEGRKKFGLKMKPYFELIVPLRDELQNIFDIVKEGLQEESIINDDW